ncbi:MAG: type VI secretion system baseplate subunit TssF [Myxococcales bacterium]|nr:type VI secretion system baseplate subunit TssF [Myxococcales bacterium]MCB9717382.1 type VI secretion system baseplate subunit TssF [Myxococcales bacterium]
MKSRYYEAELAYLREQGREFARSFPATAGFLAERSDDPDVERLLEGFAFLASRIRERVDDGMPEFAQQLGQILVPQLTRYMPSCSIVCFEPDARALRTAVHIPRGAEVAGKAQDGTRCRFQITQPTDLLPLELLDLRTSRTTARREKIALQLRIPPQGLESVRQASIRLFLHGEIPFATTLRAWFVHHCHEVTVVVDGKEVGKLRDKPKGRGFEPDVRLLPEKPLEHDAFASIAELFAFPQKFCFVDLPPLGKHAAEELELHLTFDNPPDLPHRVIRDDIRLHCAPVVNLFSTVSDPGRFQPLKPEVLVRVSERSPTELEVYDITKVIGSREGRQQEYAPFSSYGVGESEAPHDEVYYVTRRVPSITDSGTDLYVSLMTPRDAAPLERNEVLSMNLLCSNRGAAATLAIGEINQPVRGSPVFVKFSNITAPTPPLYPHDDVELLWRLAAHVGLSRRGLEDGESLRRMLRSYNFAARFNAHQGRLNGLWIDAIREVRSRKLVRLYRGAPVTGTKTIVTVDESEFGGQGEAALLGEALSEMYARLVHVNSFNQLVVQLAPSLREYTWKPRNGNLRLG